MIIFGYVKDYRYTGDGTLEIQVRIPTIHGAYRKSDYGGKKLHNYVEDKDLPWYPSLLLPYKPSEGEVVAISSLDGTPSNFLVIGLTGGSYNSGATSLLQ